MASLYDHPRADWTDTRTRAHRFDHTVKGVYLHYPGAGNVKLLDDTDEQIASRLRGYRNGHVNGQGWKDIGYNAAIDGRGRSWELRGIDNESGANGGSASNNEAVAILLLIGNNEQPTAAMLAGVNRLLAKVRAMHPKAAYIRGHQQSPDASTDCPGKPVMAAIRAGKFSYDGVPAAPVEKGKLRVTGTYDRDVHAEVQRRLGRPVDGRLGLGDLAALCQFFGLPTYTVISDQPRTAAQVGDAIVPRIWDHDPAHTGPNSVLVRHWEAYVGATVDRGSWGPQLNERTRIMLNEHPALFTDADRGVAKARAEKAGL